MKHSLAWAGALGLVLLSGCYVESHEDKPTLPRGGAGELDDDGDELGLDEIKCQYSKKTGCFEGTISPAPYIYVNGKEFIDADDFGAHFTEVVKPLIDSKDVTTLRLLTPIDNRSFSRGFTAFLEGRRSVSARVNSNGVFMAHRLAPGAYDVRAARPIRFEVSRGSQEGDSVQTYCASLFGEATVDIASGRRTDQEVFDDFQLVVSSRGCSEDSLRF